MHTFNLVVGSMLGHPIGVKLVSENQTLVRYFRMSHTPNRLLTDEAKSQGIRTGLVSSNKTRFTSVHRSIEATVKLESAFAAVMRKNPNIVQSKEVCSLS